MRPATTGPTPNRCADCGRSVRYDEAREQYVHVDGRPCFLNAGAPEVLPEATAIECGDPAGPLSRTTWFMFGHDNPGLVASGEMDDVRVALLAGREYRGGGGAAPVFVVRLAPAVRTRILCACGHAEHEGSACSARDSEGVGCDCTEGHAGDGDRLPALVVPDEVTDESDGFAVTVWLRAPEVKDQAAAEARVEVLLDIVRPGLDADETADVIPD